MSDRLLPPDLPTCPPSRGDPKRRTRFIVAGFVTGLLLWLAIFTAQIFPPPQRDNYFISLLVFDMFALPLTSLVLALIPKTRPYGLGLLLACGLGWLVILAICGGAMR